MPKERILAVKRRQATASHGLPLKDVNLPFVPEYVFHGDSTTYPLRGGRMSVHVSRHVPCTARPVRAIRAEPCISAAQRLLDIADGNLLVAWRDGVCTFTQEDRRTRGWNFDRLGCARMNTPDRGGSLPRVLALRALQGRSDQNEL